MLKLLHLSDLHFGPRYLPHVGEAVLRCADTLGPDVVVVSGDFTQRAKRRQFADAQSFLRRLPAVPQVVVPGNHDVPLYRVGERIAKPHALYSEYISADLNQQLALEGLRIAALDSTAPHTAITNGRITSAHLEYCERVFRDAPAESARIVVAHHPFLTAPDYEGGKTVRGGQRALRRFTELGVDLILGGHLHRSYVGSSRDTGREAAREDDGILIVQSGTTTSSRGRASEHARNSFNLISLDTQNVKIENFLLVPGGEEFQQVARHEFPRSR